MKKLNFLIGFMLICGSGALFGMGNDSKTYNVPNLSDYVLRCIKNDCDRMLDLLFRGLSMNSKPKSTSQSIAKAMTPVIFSAYAFANLHRIEPAILSNALTAVYGPLWRPTSKALYECLDKFQKTPLSRSR